MLLWTNDPNWAYADPPPEAIAAATKTLELFLCHFQDKELHEHLAGDCDVAFLNLWVRNDEGAPIAPMALRLVVPRDRGTYWRMLEWWHPSTSWQWPHSGAHLGDRGWTGLCDPDPEYPCRRFKVETMMGDDHEPATCLDAVDLFGRDYNHFLVLAAKARLAAFGVEVSGDRQLQLKPMKELHSFRHQVFSLEPG